LNTNQTMTLTKAMRSRCRLQLHKLSMETCNQRLPTRRTTT